MTFEKPIRISYSWYFKTKTGFWCTALNLNCGCTTAVLFTLCVVTCYQENLRFFPFDKLHPLYLLFLCQPYWHPCTLMQFQNFCSKNSWFETFWITKISNFKHFIILKKSPVRVAYGDRLALRALLKYYGLNQILNFSIFFEISIYLFIDFSFC